MKFLSSLILLFLSIISHSLIGSDGKESVCSAGNLEFDPRGYEDPWRNEWQPASVVWPEKSQEQRSLLGVTVSGDCRVRHDWEAINTAATIRFSIVNFQTKIYCKQNILNKKTLESLSSFSWLNCKKNRNLHNCSFNPTLNFL